MDQTRLLKRIISLTKDDSWTLVDEIDTRKGKEYWWENIDGDSITANVEETEAGLKNTIIRDDEVIWGIVENVENAEDAEEDDLPIDDEDEEDEEVEDIEDDLPVEVGEEPEQDELNNDNDNDNDNDDNDE